MNRYPLISTWNLSWTIVDGPYTWNVADVYLLSRKGVFWTRRWLLDFHLSSKFCDDSAITGLQKEGQGSLGIHSKIEILGPFIRRKWNCHCQQVCLTAIPFLHIHFDVNNRKTHTKKTQRQGIELNALWSTTANNRQIMHTLTTEKGS